MRSGTTVRILFTLGVGWLFVPDEARAQDPCPSASGVDAEAGWTAYQDGDMSEARLRFSAAMARCDNDHYARTGLGYVALRDGDTSEAQGLLRAVVMAEPNNVDALVGLGLGAWRSGDLQAVRDHFGRVIQLTPDHPTAIEYLDLVTGAEAAATVESDGADRAWADGNTELALERYSTRLDTDATDGVALLRVGLIRAWSEQYDAAMELLNLLIDLEPNNIDARLARARVRAWSGDIPRAQADVREILDVVPDNVDALAAFALFQSWSGQLDEALASYDALLSIAPEYGAGQRQQAQALAWAAEHEQSLASFRALVAENPDDVDARLGLATALSFSGDFDAALDEFDQGIARAPRDMRGLAGKARTLGWAGRLIESERAALRAVNIDTASGEAWGSLGQAYRGQGRDAAAQEALRIAAGFSPTNPEIRDQLRSVDLALAPLARPTVTAESDSDGNRMLTTSLATSWHPAPRLDLRLSGYYKQLEQEFTTNLLERTSYSAMLTGVYQLRPGWTVTTGVGGTTTDGEGDPQFVNFNANISTPDRFPFGLGVTVASSGLDETAALADRGVRSSEAVLSARWFPGPQWRVNGNVSIGEYQGTEANGRRGAYLATSRKLGRLFSLGASFRGFTFEKNLNDGYFDPDFYGIAELTSYWLYRPVPWSFLIELAPGIQQVAQDGDPSSSLRSNARIGYRVGQGRELSLSYGYSSAGLTSFATGDSGYSYNAIILGFNWIF
ncbi:MAG: tetratricopeptide repeat protein [Longimicrobiales bacterium]